MSGIPAVLMFYLLPCMCSHTESERIQVLTPGSSTSGNTQTTVAMVRTCTSSSQICFLKSLIFNVHTILSLRSSSEKCNMHFINMLW